MDKEEKKASGHIAVPAMGGWWWWGGRILKIHRLREREKENS